MGIASSLGRKGKGSGMAKGSGLGPTRKVSKAPKRRKGATGGGVNYGTTERPGERLRQSERGRRAAAKKAGRRRS